MGVREGVVCLVEKNGQYYYVLSHLHFILAVFDIEGRPVQWQGEKKTDSRLILRFMRAVGTTRDYQVTTRYGRMQVIYRNLLEKDIDPSPPFGNLLMAVTMEVFYESPEKYIKEFRKVIGIYGGEY